MITRLVTASQIEVDTDQYEAFIRDLAYDLVRTSEDLTKQDADHAVDNMMQDTMQRMQAIRTSLARAIHAIPNWHGSLVQIKPVLPAREYMDFVTGVGAAHVYVGKADFALDESGDIDDVIESGDMDFFRDPNQEMDYFNLIEELRHPGRVKQQAEKKLHLWTARPSKDARLYEHAREIPSRIFLSSKADDAAGIGADFGDRDLYLVVVESQYVTLTLDRGSLKHYQTIVTPNGKVPIVSIERM